jgi:DNA-binding phage protein
MVKDISHDEAMAKLFANDPAFARAYVTDVQRDGEPKELAIEARQIKQANALAGIDILNGVTDTNRSE